MLASFRTDSCTPCNFSYAGMRHLLGTFLVRGQFLPRSAQHPLLHLDVVEAFEERRD